MMRCDRCDKEITDPYTFDEIIGGDYCRKCSSILYQEWWDAYFRKRDGREEMKSKCCGAGVHVVYHKYGGKRWHCDKCGKPCEVVI